MKQVSFLLILLSTLTMVAQQSLTLEECYRLVTLNYPLAKQLQFIEKQYLLDAEVISIAKLPKLDLNAQATYQSDVVEVPIPNANITPLNKDQYRVSLSVSQLIYNGGLTDAAIDLKAAQLKTRKKQLELSLYQLKKQVNQLYFSILLVKETDVLLKAKRAQLQAKLKEVKSGVKHGVMLPASDKVLEVELLKIKQQFVEILSNKTIYMKSLSSLLNETLNAATNFQNPIVETQWSASMNRPELQLFQLKIEEVKNAEILVAKQNTPKLLGFATSGYGNPGLNILDNSFQPFYTVGVKLNWNVFDWNANKKRRESLAFKRDIIANETEVFTLNTTIELNKKQEEIKKMEAIITSDIEIIKLRKQILQTADSQLKNGVNQVI